MRRPRERHEPACPYSGRRRSQCRAPTCGCMALRGRGGGRGARGGGGGEGDVAVSWSEGGAAETAVALVYNGTPQGGMMASQRDLEECGIGLRVTEGIVAWREEVRRVRVRELAEGLDLDIEIDPAP